MQHSSLPDSGTFAHHVIDRLLPTTVEKADLKDLANGVLELQVSSADTANPPTDAELDAAFGTPANTGTGFLALLDDAGGDANVYLVATNGTSWWYATLTKAV